MDEYIRKQDAIKAACRGFCHPGALCPDELPCREQTKYLRELPPADVVPVVRCRRCLHFDSDSNFCFLIKGYMQYYDFCSYGKPR